MTILHTTDSGGGAGSSVSIALLGRAQREAGHRVFLACPEGTYLAARARSGGLEVTALDFAGLAGSAGAVASLATRLGVDVVNAHGSRDRAACRLARLAGRLDAALVMSRRAMPRSSPLSALLDNLVADSVIAVSEPVARALARRGLARRRVTVVSNAVDLSRLDRPVSPAEIETARRLVSRYLAGRGAPSPGIAGSQPAGTIGVVSRRKDHAVLLRALPLLRVAPVTLMCVGFEVGEGDPLMALARAAAPHAVAFLPFQDDVRPFYDLFDVCVLPTRDEGLSQSILEAMALGRPVVTTAIPANAELIADGTHGLLVPEGDPAAMAAALDRVLADRALAARLGAAARARARSCYGVERTLAGTDAAYRVALARRGRA